MAKSPVKPRIRAAVYTRDGYRCQYCGACVLDFALRTVDHVIPIAFGGDHGPDNLRTACKSCNSTKKDRSEQWLRLYLAFQRSPYFDVITLEQYHRLRGLGIALADLEVQPFAYEWERRAAA